MRSIQLMEGVEMKRIAIITVLVLSSVAVQAQTRLMGNHPYVPTATGVAEASEPEIALSLAHHDAFDNCVYRVGNEIHAPDAIDQNASVTAYVDTEHTVKYVATVVAKCEVAR
jgi:hypothetical protein